MCNSNNVPSEQLDQTLNATRHYMLSSSPCMPFKVCLCGLVHWYFNRLKHFLHSMRERQYRCLSLLGNQCTSPGKSQSLFIAGSVYIHVHRVYVTTSAVAAVRSHLLDGDMPTVACQTCNDLCLLIKLPSRNLQLAT